MHIFDTIVAVILLLAFFRGIKRGFFDEILGLIGVVGGLFVGILFAGPLSSWIVSQFPSLGLLAYGGCFIILYGAVFYLTRLIASSLEKIFDKLALLKWLNTLLGGLASGFKTLLFLSLLITAFSFLPGTRAFHPKGSLFYQPLYHLVPDLYKVMGAPKNLPRQVYKIFKKNYDEYLEEAMEDVKENAEKKISGKTR